jgi:hypothetical protein
VIPDDDGSMLVRRHRRRRRSSRRVGAAVGAVVDGRLDLSTLGGLREREPR